MAEDSSKSNAEHDRKERSEHKPAEPTPGAGLLTPEALPLYPDSLLSDPRLDGRGNGPVRAAMLQRMQQTYGNRATLRMLQRSTREAAAPPLAGYEADLGEEVRAHQANEAAQDAASPVQRQVVSPSNEVRSGVTVQREEPGGGAAPAAPAAGKQGAGSESYAIDNQTFDIEADSLEGAAAVMESMGDAADTTWNPVYNFNQENGKVTDATITVTITILMPNWPGATKLNQEAKAEWDRAYKALEAHEQEHVALVKKHMDGVAKRMVGQATANADKTFKSAVDELKKASKEFDKKTDHGRKTGTIIDTTKGSKPAQPAQPKLQRTKDGESDE